MRPEVSSCTSSSEGREVERGKRGVRYNRANMFTDKRSRQVVFVAHCVLNQNAKIDGCAHYPGAMRELAGLLVRSGVGVVQMPCPELLHLGLDRQADPKAPSTVESEDTRVACRMSDEAAAALCGRIANDVVQQVREYKRNGFHIVGIIGINGSPTCGVETNWYADEEVSGPGVFISAICERLQRNALVVRMRGVKARSPQEALATAEELMQSSGEKSAPSV